MNRFTKYRILQTFNKIMATKADVDESFVNFELEAEQLTFGFDLPANIDFYDDDSPVIVKEKHIAGATCKACNEFYPYSEASNQKDGSFKCYSCRRYG